MKPYDYLIVGSGLFGSTFAYLAKQRGKRCLVIDRRPHLGGNVYCKEMEGICVHWYGPHIFHTSNQDVWNLVTSIVNMNRFTLSTIANAKGKLFNLPFNMNTFYQIWGVTTPEEAKHKLETECAEYRNIEPHNLEEQALKLVGRDIYELLIKEYTEKQWGRKCTELPAFIIKRLPVRLTYNNNYFNDLYQGIPEGGYDRLVNGLLKDIECRTGCDYLENKSFWDSQASTIVYTGPIDEFYDYRMGHLEYRSLHFEHELLHTGNYQGNAIINYTTHDVPYTRIVEHKHFDINNFTSLNSPLTVITREYPLLGNDCEPFYPINDIRNSQLYERYLTLANQETNIIFGGRLATYSYVNMDEVIASAMAKFYLSEKINNK